MYSLRCLRITETVGKMRRRVQDRALPMRAPVTGVTA